LTHGRAFVLVVHADVASIWLSIPLIDAGGEIITNLILHLLGCFFDCKLLFESFVFFKNFNLSFCVQLSHLFENVACTIIAKQRLVQNLLL